MQGSGQMSLSNRDSSYGYVSLEAPILSHTEGAHGHSTCQGTRKNRWITVQLVGAIGLWGDIFVSFYLATFVLVLQKKKNVWCLKKKPLLFVTFYWNQQVNWVWFTFPSLFLFNDTYWAALVLSAIGCAENPFFLSTVDKPLTKRHRKQDDLAILQQRNILKLTNLSSPCEWVEGPSEVPVANLGMGLSIPGSQVGKVLYLCISALTQSIWLWLEQMQKLENEWVFMQKWKIICFGGKGRVYRSWASGARGQVEAPWTAVLLVKKNPPMPFSSFLLGWVSMPMDLSPAAFPLHTQPRDLQFCYWMLQHILQVSNLPWCPLCFGICHLRRGM